jgi:thiol:disulfide interchange protein DsbD
MLLALAVLASSAPSIADAKPFWMRGAEVNENDFLDPDVAFKVGARMDGGVIQVRWFIADGYYLYRSKMAVSAESPDLMTMGLALPQGEIKTDPYLGRQAVFHQQVEGTVAYRRLDYGAHPIQIKVIYQGCAEAGLCYPPIEKVLFPTAGSAGAAAVASPAHPWEGLAIVAGALAFFLAGLVLRKGRRLELPG